MSDKFALAGSTFVSLGLRVGTTVVMGRLLLPADYGLFQLVTLAPFLFTSLGDLNLPSAVVQIRGHDERTVSDTGMFLGMVMGALSILAFLAGGVYLYFYNAEALHDERAIWLALIIGVGAALAMVNGTQGALINRARKYGTETRLNLTFSLTAAGTGLAMALSGMGVYALALQSLAAQIVMTFMLSRHVPLHLPRQVSVAAMKSFARFCGGMVAASYVGNFESRFFEIGVLKTARTDPKAALGEYNRSLTVLSLVSQNLNAALDRVIFPAICAAQHDLPRARDLSRRHLEAVVLMSGFMGAWLFFNAADVVRVILGPNWGTVVPMLRILAFAVPVAAVSQAAHVTCVAMGRTFSLTITTIGRSLITLPILGLLIYLHKDGIHAILIVYVATRAAFAGGLIGLAWRIVGLPPRNTLITALATIAAAVVVGGYFFAVQRGTATFLPALAADSTFAALLRVVLFSLSGLAVYALCARVLAPDSSRYMIAMARGNRRAV